MQTIIKTFFIVSFLFLAMHSLQAQAQDSSWIETDSVPIINNSTEAFGHIYNYLEKRKDPVGLSSDETFSYFARANTNQNSIEIVKERFLTGKQIILPISKFIDMKTPLSMDFNNYIHWDHFSKVLKFSSPEHLEMLSLESKCNCTQHLQNFLSFKKLNTYDGIHAVKKWIQTVGFVDYIDIGPVKIMSLGEGIQVDFNEQTLYWGPDSWVETMKNNHAPNDNFFYLSVDYPSLDDNNVFYGLEALLVQLENNNIPAPSDVYYFIKENDALLQGN